MSYKRVMLIGNVGREPAIRQLPDGTSGCSFGVAVNSGIGERQRTDWFSVFVVGKQAEACAKYLKKGSKVFVDGDFKTGVVTSKQTGMSSVAFDVRASRVVFLTQAAKGAPQQQELPQLEDAQDDVPF